VVVGTVTAGIGAGSNVGGLAGTGIGAFVEGGLVGESVG
jgi:hypothetical protein